MAISNTTYAIGRRYLRGRRLDHLVFHDQLIGLRRSWHFHEATVFSVFTPIYRSLISWRDLA